MLVFRADLEALRGEVTRLLADIDEMLTVEKPYLLALFQARLGPWERQLQPGMLLPLQREPDNRADPLAIKILTESGHFLGYVPRVKNEALARLMDAGKLLFGKLEATAWQGTWLKLDARIFLRDMSSSVVAD